MAVTMKVLEAPAAAIAAEGIEHIFAVMGDANQDIIAELCETHGLKYIHAHHETAAAVRSPTRQSSPPGGGLRKKQQTLECGRNEL
jgi:hypothetical protein